MKWITVKLGDLCEVVTKGTTPRTLGKSYTSSGIPFLRAENLQGDEIVLDSNTLFIDEETNQILARSRIYPGDVLISIAGTIGRGAIVSDSSSQMNCNQAVAIIRVSNPLDNRFLLHWIKTTDAQTQMYGARVTLTISNLSLGQIKQLQIPLPPLSEQHHIVEILDQADALRKKRAEADAKAEQILPALFIKKFGEPSEWLSTANTKPISSLVNVRGRGTYAALKASSSALLSQVGTAGHGTRKLDTDALLKTPILIPSRSKLDAFRKEMTLCRKVVSGINKTKIQIEKLFELLLQRAFSGDITVKWREAHISELLTETEQQTRILGTTAELHYEQLPLIETQRHST